MATELLHIEADSTLGFGDYTLLSKTKVEDFEFQGDLYKVKTFAEITKLEKNGMFVYESVPGTTVSAFKITDEGIRFSVSGKEAVQITVELEPKQTYSIYVADSLVGEMTTNISGKLSVSMELDKQRFTAVEIKK